METETIEHKIERLRKKAEILRDNNIKSFVKDYYLNYHFCFIEEVTSNWIIVEGFKGQRKGESTRIFWSDVYDIQEYKEDLE